MKVSKAQGAYLIQENHQFHRSPRGITLPEAGESVYKDAKSLLRGYDSLIRNAREAASRSPFLIRVGTSFLAPCKVLMDLWAKVNDKFPQFKVQIVPFEYTNENILSILENLGADFDFIVSPCDSIRWRSLCNFYQLGCYEVAMAVSHSHPSLKTISVDWNYTMPYGLIYPLKPSKDVLLLGIFHMVTACGIKLYFHLTGKRSAPALFFHIFDHMSRPAAVCHKRNNRFPCKISLVQKSMYRRRHGIPPGGRSYGDYIIL